MLLVVGLLHLSFMYSGSFSRLNAEDVVSLVWGWANLSRPLGENYNNNNNNIHICIAPYCRNFRGAATYE